MGKKKTRRDHRNKNMLRSESGVKPKKTKKKIKMLIINLISKIPIITIIILKTKIIIKKEIIITTIKTIIEINITIVQINTVNTIIITATIFLT